jgi:hypothetical protein
MVEQIVLFVMILQIKTNVTGALIVNGQIFQDVHLVIVEVENLIIITGEVK